MRNNGDNLSRRYLSETEGNLNMDLDDDDDDAYLDSYLDDYAGMPLNSDTVLENFVQDDKDADVEKDKDMRGRHNAGRIRAPNRRREPCESVFYTNYIDPADDTEGFEDKVGTIWDPVSSDGVQFRNRFAVPYGVFDGIVTDWKRHSGEYRALFDCAGRPSADPLIYILGSLRILAKGITFDAAAELSNLSAQSIHLFFKKFISWFTKFYWKDWVKFPETPEEIDKVENYYRDCGLPGCLGSIDVVHCKWEMCPAGIQSDCTGKEAFATLGWEVVASHTRKILAVTQAFFGSWNDITIVRFDDTVTAIRKNPLYTEREFQTYDKIGNKVKQTGFYFICDGGYHRWKVLVPPYKNQIKGSMTEKWSKHVESMRKDVECTFGILKKRFVVLKHGNRFHNKEDIDLIFHCCCVLHNMCHEFDNYDNWEADAVIEEELVELQLTVHSRQRAVRLRELIRANDDQYRLNRDLPLGIDGGEEVECFHRRRGALIEHFEYLRSTGVNLVK